MDGYFIFLIVVIVAFTIMYIATQICDVFKERYIYKGEKENEDTKDVKKE